MSGLLGKLFGTGAGGKGGGKGPSPQEAIQRLRDTEEMLSKKQEFLEKKIEQELAAARKHGTKNKRGERGGAGPRRPEPGQQVGRALGQRGHVCAAVFQTRSLYFIPSCLYFVPIAVILCLSALSAGRPALPGGIDAPAAFPRCGREGHLPSLVGKAPCGCRGSSLGTAMSR